MTRPQKCLQVQYDCNLNHKVLSSYLCQEMILQSFFHIESLQKHQNMASVQQHMSNIMSFETTIFVSFLCHQLFLNQFFRDNYDNSALVKTKYGFSNTTETENEIAKYQMQTSVFPKNALFYMNFQLINLSQSSG